MVTDWDSATRQSTMHLTAIKAGLLTQPSIWHWHMCDHAPSLHQNLRRYPFHLRCFLIRCLNLQALSIWFAMRRRIASIWAIWRMSASSCWTGRLATFTTNVRKFRMFFPPSTQTFLKDSFNLATSSPAFWASQCRVFGSVSVWRKKLENS